MLGSHLFNGTNVTPENEEYMYSINKTEIKKKRGVIIFVWLILKVCGIVFLISHFNGIN